MKLLLRLPFHPNDAREPMANWPTTVFVMLASGFVIWELCTEWPAAEEAFLLIPHRVSQQIGATWLSGYLNAIWGLGIVPLAIWSLLVLALRLLKHNVSLGAGWRRMALPIAVVVSAGHMTKALAKFVSWAGFLPYVLKDPYGTGTIQNITNKTISTPAALLPLSAVSMIGTTLIIIGLLFAIREARLANPHAHYSHLFPKFALTGVFLFIVVGWALWRH